jgi:tRNA(fMet)-specific endonuclease VapC
MYVLDTDHASLLWHPASNEAGKNLRSRLRVRGISRPHVSIVTPEEQMRGWLSAVAKERKARRQVFAYRELQELFTFYGKFDIVPFDDRAADRFEAIRGLSIGTMDLKIASICLVSDATLLTRNTRDFGKVPGLKIEDWTV